MRGPQQRRPIETADRLVERRQQRDQQIGLAGRGRRIAADQRGDGIAQQGRSIFAAAGPRQFGDELQFFGAGKLDPGQGVVIVARREQCARGVAGKAL